MDRHLRRGMLSQIWDECESRYEGFSRKALKLKIPYFKTLSIKAVRRVIAERLQKVNAWPEWLAAHHVQRLRLTTESTPSIAKILSNVNQPWREHKGCTCEKIKQQLRAAGYKGTLPTIDGHNLLHRS